MWDLPKPGIEPVSPAMQADSLPQSRQGNPADWFFITKPALPMPCLQDGDVYFPEMLGVLAADGSQLSALSGIAPGGRKFLAQGFIPSKIAAQWLVSTMVQRPGPLTSIQDNPEVNPQLQNTI